MRRQRKSEIYAINEIDQSWAIGANQVSRRTGYSYIKMVVD